MILNSARSVRSTTDRIWTCRGHVEHWCYYLHFV